MNVIFKKENFNTIEFVELLERDGFDIYNIGGTSISSFTNGTVSESEGGEIQLVGENSMVSIYSASTFLKTLNDVEKKFGYRLFQ